MCICLKNRALKDVVQKVEDVAVDSGAESSGDDLVRLEVDETPKEKWDCESILSGYSGIGAMYINKLYCSSGIFYPVILIFGLFSELFMFSWWKVSLILNHVSGTYSNLYNHPKTIEEPSKSKVSSQSFNQFHLICLCFKV